MTVAKSDIGLSIGLTRKQLDNPIKVDDGAECGEGLRRGSSAFIKSTEENDSIGNDDAKNYVNTLPRHYELKYSFRVFESDSGRI